MNVEPIESISSPKHNSLNRLNGYEEVDLGNPRLSYDEVVLVDHDHQYWLDCDRHPQVEEVLPLPSPPPTDELAPPLPVERPPTGPYPYSEVRLGPRNYSNGVDNLVVDGDGMLIVDNAGYIPSQ